MALADNPQKPVVSLGSTVWFLIPPGFVVRSDAPGFHLIGEPTEHCSACGRLL